MGMTTKDLNAFLQRHGLFPDKKALVLLKERVDKAADPKTELDAIVKRIKGNTNLIKNKVPAEIVQEALAVEGDEENDTSENLMILDHKNVPISVYDPVRKVMVRKGGSERSLQENLEPTTRIQAFRERFELVEQRVQNNHIFAKRSFVVDETAAARPDLTRISGIRRAEGLVCVLGMLTQPEEGVFYLEDLSARVQVDMSESEASVGLFTENCIIIVEGVMNESKDVFKAHCLAMPPFEDRPVTCSRFPALAVPTNRKPYTPEELQEMLVEEGKQEGTQMVVLSDVWLDRTRVMSGLRKLFGRFLIACQDAEASGADVFFIFVLMGNFVSQPAVHGVATHRELFDRLAAMLEPMEALLLRSCFVIVPGPNDVVAGNTLMLPRNPLPDAIAKGFKDKIPASTFASSPCRIKFYTQELVLHRDDLCCKLRTFSRKPTEGKELHDHAIKTILCQGHLAPLPLHAAPIDWAYDHALRLYPLPSLLVLGERNSHYEKEYQTSKVTNPGCFAADFSFALYEFVGHELQVCYMDEVDEVSEAERVRRAEVLALAKKRKDKKRKERVAARQVAMDNEGDALHVEQKRGQSKTPKTRKKPPPHEETKGGITSFFARRPVRMEEEEDAGAQRSRRRLRQRSDSDDNESDSQIESDENGDEDDIESSGGEETVEVAAGAQDSGREEGEEEEARIVHQKSRSSVLSRTKRNRLEESDSEGEEREAFAKEGSSKTAAALSTKSSAASKRAAITKSASDDAEEFVYRPSPQTTAYSSV